MTVGTCRIELEIPANRSLKGKRQVIKSIKDRVRSHFNVAIAEVDRLDEWQRATLGVACVGNDPRVVNEVLSKVVNLVEGCHQALILDYEIDLVSH
ncbi:MAG: DUF503 domain-containing protein [candidate division NC10 bacterium]|nr:DUF503 domain-containing protein [candidate division NC10 bacterium]